MNFEQEFALLQEGRILDENVITLDDLTIDIPKQKVTKGKRDVYLTRKEFMLLECLMKNNPNVVSRGKIMDYVWNNDTDPLSNTVEAHILNLRKKIEKGKKKIIHTVSGRGYKADTER